MPLFSFGPSKKTDNKTLTVSSFLGPGFQRLAAGESGCD